jgi:hypothetical protein
VTGWGGSVKENVGPCPVNHLTQKQTATVLSRRDRLRFSSTAHLSATILTGLGGDCRAKWFGGAGRRHFDKMLIARPTESVLNQELAYSTDNDRKRRWD